MTDIHKNLKKLRLAKNLTQENVAQKIGVTRQAISGYESGRTQPGIDLRFNYLDKAYGFESLAYQIFMVGGIILLVLDLVMKKPLSMKNKWKIVGLLILISFGISIGGGICTPIQKGNLMLLVYHSIICMILWMLVDIIGQRVKRYQQNHKKTDQ